MKPRLRFIHVLIAILATALVACAPGGKPTVIVVSPPSGSQYFEGEDVAVQSVTTDAAGVVRVELVVDGTTVRVDPSPTAQGQPNFNVIQTWKAAVGVHTILVRAYNSAGAMSDPAGVTVNILQKTAQAPTATPTTSAIPPIATITLTPVLPTLTPSPMPQTPVPGACTNTASFTQDVTVPDGTNWAQGQAFNKIWQVRNTGTCPWSGYQFVFANGEAMTTNTTTPIPTTAPGATVDILVPMTAPTTPGAHAGQWRLRSPSGVFGPVLSVSINVIGSVGSPSGCSGTPNISSFTASASSVPAGTAVTLNWGAVTNADSAEIDQGIGGVETPGSRTVNPTANTTYTLTAHCGTNAAIRQVTITVTAGPSTTQPDLSVTSVDFNPTVPAPGASFQIRITINNSGSTAASNFYVRALSQTPGAACPGPGTVLFDRITSIGASTSTVFTENASIATAGTLPICVILDHTNVITESNESNNSLQRNLTVGLPDLRPDGMGMTGGWSPHAGTNVQVSITLRNDGDVIANSFNVRLLQQNATDACPGPGTVLFDQTAGPIAAHGSSVLVQTVQLTAGAHRFCIWLDHMNNVTESNESNNSLQVPTAPFTVLP